MPDNPHRGPNVSRIQLEGAGGFIYALTPVLILLFTAPLVLLVAVAAGAALAPLIHLGTRRPARNLTAVLGSISGFVIGLALTLLIGDNRTFRLIALVSVAGGLAAAVVINWRSSRVHHPSIRDHNL